MIDTAISTFIGKHLLALYLGRGSVGSSFGTADSLVVLLVWIYWSANIFLFGAEFTRVASRSGRSGKQLTAAA